MLLAYATFDSIDASEQIWYLDSAASSHITPDDGKLLIKTPYSSSSLVKVGNRTLLPIKHVDHSTIATSTKPMHLRSVHHVPKLHHNLLSVRKLCSENNCSVVFYSNSVRVKDTTTGDILLQAPSVGNVYPVSLPNESPLVLTNLAFSTSGDHWHHRLGHCGARVVAILKNCHYLNISSTFHDTFMTFRLSNIIYPSHINLLLN